MKKITGELRILHGPQKGKILSIEYTTFVIGRDQDCNLFFDIESVSRRHAQIQRQGRRHYIHDLDSLNGTFVNGVRITGSQVLEHDDEIQIGSSVLLLFCDPNATKSDSLTKQALLSRGVSIDKKSKQVMVRLLKLEPPLKALQFRLLSYFVDHAGEIVTRDDIAQHLWPDHKGGVTEDQIYSQVSRLRQRLKSADPSHDYIRVKRGRGYIFSNP